MNIKKNVLLGSLILGVNFGSIAAPISISIKYSVPTIASDTVKIEQQDLEPENGTVTVSKLTQVVNAALKKDKEFFSYAVRFFYNPHTRKTIKADLNNTSDTIEESQVKDIKANLGLPTT